MVHRVKELFAHSMYKILPSTGNSSTPMKKATSLIRVSVRCNLICMLRDCIVRAAVTESSASTKRPDQIPQLRSSSFPLATRFSLMITEVTAGLSIFPLTQARDPAS